MPRSINGKEHVTSRKKWFFALDEVEEPCAHCPHWAVEPLLAPSCSVLVMQGPGVSSLLCSVPGPGCAAAQSL